MVEGYTPTLDLVPRNNKPALASEPVPAAEANPRLATEIPYARLIQTEISLLKLEDEFNTPAGMLVLKGFEKANMKIIGTESPWAEFQELLEADKDDSPEKNSKTLTVAGRRLAIRATKALNEQADELRRAEDRQAMSAEEFTKEVTRVAEELGELRNNIRTLQNTANDKNAVTSSARDGQPYRDWQTKTLEITQATLSQTVPETVGKELVASAATTPIEQIEALKVRLASLDTLATDTAVTFSGDEDFAKLIADQQRRITHQRDEVVTALRNLKERAPLPQKQEDGEKDEATLINEAIEADSDAVTAMFRPRLQEYFPGKDWTEILTILGFSYGAGKTERIERNGTEYSRRSDWSYSEPDESNLKAEVTRLKEVALKRIEQAIETYRQSNTTTDEAPTVPQTNDPRQQMEVPILNPNNTHTTLEELAGQTPTVESTVAVAALESTIQPDRTTKLAERANYLFTALLRGQDVATSVSELVTLLTVMPSVDALTTIPEGTSPQVAMDLLKLRDALDTFNKFVKAVPNATASVADWPALFELLGIKPAIVSSEAPANGGLPAFTVTPAAAPTAI